MKIVNEKTLEMMDAENECVFIVRTKAKWGYENIDDITVFKKFAKALSYYHSNIDTAKSRIREMCDEDSIEEAEQIARCSNTMVFTTKSSDDAHCTIIIQKKEVI